MVPCCDAFNQGVNFSQLPVFPKSGDFRFIRTDGLANRNKEPEDMRFNIINGTRIFKKRLEGKREAARGERTRTPVLTQRSQRIGGGKDGKEAKMAANARARNENISTVVRFELRLVRSQLRFV